MYSYNISSIYLLFDGYIVYITYLLSRWNARRWLSLVEIHSDSLSACLTASREICHVAHVSWSIYIYKYNKIKISISTAIFLVLTKLSTEFA